MTLIFVPKSNYNILMRLTVYAIFTAILQISLKSYGRSQAKVIVWPIVVVLKRPMLHAKFEGILSIGSGGDLFRDL